MKPNIPERKKKSRNKAVQKRKQYSMENLRKALEAVRQGMPKKLASKTFNVPRGTIQSRLRNKTTKDLPGPNPILTQEEEKTLVNWIVDCCQKGFPKRKTDLQLSVANFLKKSKRDNPFKDDIPGNKWYDLFLRRHPELSERTAEAVTSASSAVSEEDIKGWFKRIESYLKDNNYFDILQDATRVYNGDESNFQLCPKSGRVIALRGDRDVYEVDQAAAKSSLTVLFTFGADGDVTPPLIVFPNKRLPKDIAVTIPDEWGIGLSDSGWMKAELFGDYIKNVFHPYLIKKKPKFPVILFVDGHKSHLSLEVSELCSSLKIILVALYPNATRILQPADVAAFRPLKAAWKESVLKWRRDHPLETFSKNYFCPVLKEALDIGIKPETVINGFKTTGLYPWNAEAINYKKCLGKSRKTSEIPGQGNPRENQHNTNSTPVMTLDIFTNIVGEEKISFVQNNSLESLSESDKILKKLHLHFQNFQNPVTVTSLSDEAEKPCESNKDSNHDNMLVEELDLNSMPIFYIDDITVETQTLDFQVLDNSSNKITDDKENEQIINIDKQQHNMTPIKLQDVLVKEKTPIRKGVKEVKRTSFVLTSAEWQKDEMEKHKAKKLKEDLLEERKKIRIEKKEQKIKIASNKTKFTKKRQNTNKTQKNTTENQKEKRTADHTDNDSQISSIDSEVVVSTHKVQIHDDPKTKTSSIQAKPKEKKADPVPTEKIVTVLSDYKVDCPKLKNTQQVTPNSEDVEDVEDDDILDHIIKNKKKFYSLEDLEKIFCEE